MIAFVVFGSILLFLSFSLKNSLNPLSRFTHIFKIAGFAFLVVGAFSSMFKQIDAGNVDNEMKSELQKWSRKKYKSKITKKANWGRTKVS